jgi:hypothetical protein
MSAPTAKRRILAVHDKDRGGRILDRARGQKGVNR